IGKTIAIYLDGTIISSPVVNVAIPNGQAVIEGGFTLVEAKDLARSLNEGALPVPVALVNQRSIGPSLGVEALEHSVLAGAFAIVCLAIFMIGYYRFPGLIAMFALTVYGLLLLAIFKLWPITLTLSGIAGFILSLGMAVDANVLIFERLKEELRQGKSLQSAMDDGFKRAWLSIRDSNVSSLITCLILTWFGTSLIKGFALTLAIGILLSLFTAITVTRTLLKLFAVKRQWWYGL
ncbi:MAG: preprotein translocase subunit SecD, partial [uncultured bacterium]